MYMLVVVHAAVRSLEKRASVCSRGVDAGGLELAGSVAR